ncbi:unnamed protein product [Prorocentrum cordatum]|uniref:Uncharacterized protein n=1 Tax=Prorocentrum cordatum TaxID=2364126 RepID=A0ABN9WWS0_9DINO|nr:unnamed protein product [Polarella glacialis]
MTTTRKPAAHTAIPASTSQARARRGPSCGTGACASTRTSCTEHAADKSLCCLPDLGQEMEGLLLIQNAGFAKLGDTDNKGTVASVVSAAIAEHVGIDEDLIEIALSASLKGDPATNCDFMIELGDLNESVVADIRTKFKNKDPSSPDGQHQPEARQSGGHPLRSRWTLRATSRSSSFSFQTAWSTRPTGASTFAGLWTIETGTRLVVRQAAWEPCRGRLSRGALAQHRG